MSASVHCLLLIILGLCAAHSGLSGTAAPRWEMAAARSSPRKAAATITTTTARLDGSHGDALDALPSELRDAPRGQANAADQGEAAADLASGPFTDTQRLAVAAVGGGGPLASVLGTKPPIDFAGRTAFGRIRCWGAAGSKAVGVGTAKTATRGSQGSKNSPGGYARTGVFGVQGEGLEVRLCVRSLGQHGRTRRQAPLAAAKSQLIASLKKLRPDASVPDHLLQRAAARLQSVGQRPAGWYSATTSNKISGRAIHQQHHGRRRHRARGRFGDGHADGARRDFFSDRRRRAAAQLRVRCARIARINKGTSINAIEFGFGPQEEAENFLVRLARENGGKHVYVDISQLPRP